MRGRRIGVAALLVIGTLLWTAFGLGLWAKRQALETDEWVNTSAELLENEQVRTALAGFIVDRLYDSEAVQQRIEEVLPPRLDPLAAPAAAGLKEVARRNAPRVLGSAAALNAWEAANRTAHDELLTIVEDGVAGRAVSLDLKSLVSEIAAGTGLPADAVDRLPPDVANLQIASGDNLETARELLNLFEAIVWVLLFLALAAFGGAIALARDRRRMVVNVGGCLMFAAIALLALRTLAGKALVDALADAPNAHGVADEVWAIATSLLVDAAQGSFLFGLFVVLGGWLAGAGKRATAVRRFSAHPLREHAALVWAGLGVLLLLLVIWGPVPWTQRPVPLLIFIVLAVRVAGVDPPPHARGVPGRAPAGAAAPAPARSHPDRRYLAMTEIGPVQLLNVGFDPGANFEGRIADELARLETDRTIRVLDLLFVARDTDSDELVVLEHQEESMGAIVGALLGLQVDDADPQEHSFGFTAGRDRADGRGTRAGRRGGPDADRARLGARPQAGDPRRGRPHARR